MSRRFRFQRQSGQVLVLFAQLLAVAAIVMVFMVDAIPVFMRLSRYQADAIREFENHIVWTPTADDGLGPGYISLISGPWRCSPWVDGGRIYRENLRSRPVICDLLSDFLPPSGSWNARLRRVMRVMLSYQPHPACDGGNAIVARAWVEWRGGPFRLWRFTTIPGPIEVTRAFCELP